MKKIFALTAILMLMSLMLLCGCGQKDNNDSDVSASVESKYTDSDRKGVVFEGTVGKIEDSH